MKRTGKYIFGIDLGMTNSVISYVDTEEQILSCRNENGTDVTPSVVDLSDVNPVVGQLAKDNKVFYPHSVLDFFKCEMGQGNAVKYYGENFDKETTAIELSAEVLKYLTKYASGETDSEVSDVVITVPAYFSTEEKRATKVAAEKAGLKGISLLEEPIAATIYYRHCMENETNEIILVYTLGGGTFDVSAIEINDKEYHCFLADGDLQLGGKDWDFCMQEIIKNKLAENGIDYEELDVEDDATIQNEAEKAKKSLTSKTVTEIRLRLSTGRARFEVTRQEFEKATKSLLERTIEITHRVKQQAEEKSRKITKIILVGGSSYMPQVQERLVAEFPDLEVPNPINPNLAVSKGAAWFGYRESEKKKQVPYLVYGPPPFFERRKEF